MAILRSIWLLLALQVFQPADAETPSLPGTLEVDLMFPRSGTFAPTALTPIVFAVQNAPLLDILKPTISWSIHRDDVDEDWAIRGGVELKSPDPSNRSYFAYNFTEQLGDREGSWRLIWSVNYAMCSSRNGTVRAGYEGLAQILLFRTKNGTQQPDLVAATDDGTCDKLQNLAMNVTGLVDLSGQDSMGLSSCAFISSPKPTARPCEVKIDQGAASSISAAITATACADLRPKISCPTGENGAARVRLSIWAVCLPVMFGWLAHTFA